MRRQQQLPAGNINIRIAVEEQILRKARVVIGRIGGQAQVRREIVTDVGFDTFEPFTGRICQGARTRGDHQILEVEQEQFCLVGESAARGGTPQARFIALGRLRT